MTERVVGVARPMVENFKPTIVSSLVEIPKMDPFVGGSNLSVVMDLDGVLCGRGKNNTLEINLEKLKSLGEIAAKSREIMFYSSRKPMNEESFLWKEVFGSVFERQSITTFPFLTGESMQRLSGYIKNCNPNCSVYFNLNGELPEDKKKRIEEKEKKTKKDQSKEFYDFCARVLRQDRRLVVIGSNVSDRKEAQQMARVMELNGYDRNRIFCFNTGLLLV